MNIVLVSSLVVLGVVVIGAVLAFFFFQMSNLINKERVAMEVERSQFNPNVTAGHDITVDAETTAQLKEARMLAAKRAARTPRGANMRIGSMGKGEQPTASDGIDSDPVTAVKIAEYHTWQGLVPGSSKAVAATKPQLAKTQTAPPLKSADDLVAGKDYPEIAITDEMSPAEVRKARIANAKAKSAAIKALKTAGAAPAPSAQPVETVKEAPVETAPASAPTVAPAVGEPVAGVDYEVIEITDDMDPAEIRKARIANAKAKSAAMKAFKEAGGQTQAAAPAAKPVPASVSSSPQEAEAEQPESPEGSAVEDAAASSSPPSDIPAPVYVEITDDMSPEDTRAARIQNAKARSAYVKALKAAGIDPSTVDL